MSFQENLEIGYSESTRTGGEKDIERSRNKRRRDETVHEGLLEFKEHREETQGARVRLPIL